MVMIISYLKKKKLIVWWNINIWLDLTVRYKKADHSEDIPANRWFFVSRWLVCGSLNYK